MAFLVVSPRTVRSPIWKYTPLGSPRRDVATTPPMTPSGNASTIVMGTIQLSYSAARQRKITMMEKAKSSGACDFAIRSWKEKDGLPWRVVTAIDVDKKTGDVWLGLFGGGLARFSGGRFDHFHQLNSGLVNDVVYGVAVEHNNVWAATTAGASRYNTLTGQWTVFTEKNSPMEEIWNYSVCYNDGKVHLGVFHWTSPAAT